MNLIYILTEKKGSCFSKGKESCINCHMDKAKIFYHNMAQRKKEKLFVTNTIGERDKLFFKKNCNSCHISKCLDCHKTDNGKFSVPSTKTCLKCHRGYFIGIEYLGLSPKDENIRFQRGIQFKRDYYLKMRKDVHYKKNIKCSLCHTMNSFLKNEKSAYNCQSCHMPSQKVIEHRIREHIKKMECYSCHSSWLSQEYGTFFIKVEDSNVKKIFPLKTYNEGYIKSSFLKKHDYPILGINERKKVSPIRPQFILYLGYIKHNKVLEENTLLKAQWKAVFPHTIQKGSVLCDGCHFSPSRFLLSDKKLFHWKNMNLIDFFSQKNQYVVNGSFFTKEKFKKISSPNKRFVKYYLKKWNTILPDENGSRK